MERTASLLQAMNSRLPPYPTYKPSNIEWLGDVPAHWEVEKGKWLFIRMDRSVRGQDEVVTCFRDGIVTLRKNRRTLGFTESLKEIGYQGIRKGDLVIHAMDGSAGAIGVSDSDGKGSPVYSVCTPKPQSDAHYFAYLLREMARRGWIQALAKGIRERSTDFRFTEFAKQQLPLPPLHEQRAIARYLDYMDRRIQRYIRAKERLIELLEEQKRAVINQAVTRGLDPDVPMKPSGVEWLGDVPVHWEVRRLKHWVGINDEALNESTNPDYRFKYIDIGSVDKGRLIKPPETMVFSAAPSRARRVISHGDTIISTVRTYLKAIWYVEHEENVELVCSTGFAVLRPLGGTFPKFVSYLVQSDSFADRVTASSVGVAYPAIPESRLASFHVAIPPHSEQMSIAGRLDSLIEKFDNQQTSAERQIELIKEYRTRLIADVVTGKLDVREAAAGLPEDEGDESAVDLEGVLEDAV